MNLNEGLKECSSLKGKMSEFQKEINRDLIVKSFETTIATAKPPVSVTPLVTEYLKTAKELEDLKQKIYVTNVQSGAISLINNVNYCKSIIPLLKNLSQIREEEIVMEGERFGQSATVVKKTANFDVSSVKETLKTAEFELKQSIAALDKINFTTQI